MGADATVSVKDLIVMLFNLFHLCVASFAAVRVSYLWHCQLFKMCASIREMSCETDRTTDRERNVNMHMP